jgi:hypothetical protein
VGSGGGVARSVAMWPLLDPLVPRKRPSNPLVRPCAFLSLALLDALSSRKRLV